MLLSALIDLLYLSWQGAVLCDIILLNFLKGAEQYKAKKFEEVLLFMAQEHVCPKTYQNLITDFPSCFVRAGVRGSDRSFHSSESREPAVTQMHEELL